MTCWKRRMRAMNNNKKDPLEAAVLVDEATKQNRVRKLLANILRGRVEIDSNGELEILPDVYEMSVADIILILLCAKLAQKLLTTKLKGGKVRTSEKMSQKDITDFLTTSDPGTIKASLHNLRNKNLIRNDEGKNFVSPPQLQKINDRLFNFVKKERKNV